MNQSEKTTQSSEVVAQSQALHECQGPAAYKTFTPPTSYPVHECRQPKKKKEWDLNEVWDSIDQNLDDIGKKMQNKLKLKEAEILDMYDKI